MTKLLKHVSAPLLVRLFFYGKIAETCKRSAPRPPFSMAKFLKHVSAPLLLCLFRGGGGRRVASPPYFILKRCKFIPFVCVIFNAYILNTFSLQWSYNIAVFPIFGSLGNHILSTQN